MDNEKKKDELVPKYLNDELGFHIEEVGKELCITDDYIKLDDEAFSRINSSFRSLPNTVNDLRIKHLTSETYKVIYDKGLGQLQRSSKNPDLFRANIVEFGTNNKIKGGAELEKLQIKVFSPVTVVFEVASIITNQYYLASIDKKLRSLDSKINCILKFLEESKKSDLWAHGRYLQEVSSNLYEICKDNQYRVATLTNVQKIRIEALSNINFYHKMADDYANKNFNSKIKKSADTKAILQKYLDYNECCQSSIYLYCYAYLVEIMLSNVTDNSFIEKAKSNIQSIIDEYNNKYIEDVQKFIDTVKSLNPTVYESVMSKQKIPPMALPGKIGLALDLVLTAGSIVADIKSSKKSSTKKEFDVQIKKINTEQEEKDQELTNMINDFNIINKLYNKPVELLMTDNAAYIKLN